ncbi:uncharacterized protein [Henckelia pumila]|uniref:uncharacterized protein isoform X2 n=1 Tax=Henckelia pumila TaxID=405737 RepID=UPI003C6E2B5B
MDLNSGTTVNAKSDQMGSSSSGKVRNSGPMFDSVAEIVLQEIIDDNKFACLMKSPNKSVVSNPIEGQSIQADENKNVGDEEEFYTSNPNNGRKEISGSSLGDNCMFSCQCKKISCLKLYCECFAAGLYCTEACCCQGCCNLKECDDEVLEARELIQSRNPLAFAPKVVRRSMEASGSDYGENGTRKSPSSARHIKGCNCKKSMCLKKYCDCYQSKVGCSDGCRCEGCQNAYGQKGENGIRKGPLSEEEDNQITDSSFIDSFYVPAPTNDSHNTYLGTEQNSTPLPFLHYNQEEDVWPFENYLLLPDYRLHVDNNYSVPETAQESLDPLSSNQESDLSNAETKDEFEFPIQCHKPEETGSSSGVSNYIKWTNSSAPQFRSGSSHYYCSNSQSWHGSQISPLIDFRGNTLDQVVAYGSELCNILKANQPGTLEDPPMSLNSVKVSSQNKKRVSSLRDPGQEFGSTLPASRLTEIDSCVPGPADERSSRSRWQQMNNTTSSNLSSHD